MYKIGIPYIKRKNAGVWLVAAMVLWAGVAFGQCERGMEGQDFWLMFLDNTEGVEENPELSVVAAASFETEINVSIPQYGWEETVTAQPGEVVRVTLPYEAAHSQTYGVVGGNGVHVTSSEPIALYASNFRFRMFDMTAVLPTESLDTEYLMQTFDGTNSMDQDEIGFVAVEDSTELCVVFREPVSILVQYEGDWDVMFYYPEDTLRVTLMRGESYQLLNNGYYGTFSGAKVFSNGKAFAAFQGSNACNVRLGNGAVQSTLDHLYEQAIPPRYWGRQFVVVPTYDYGVGSDMVEVTSSEDNCEVLFNGDSVVTLGAGETYLIELRQLAAQHGGETEGYLLETSEPACLILYMGVDTIADGNVENQYHNIGDPSTVYIPPTDQGPSSMMFQTVNTEVIQLHYVNVTVKTEDTTTVRFNGERVPFTPLECGYSFATLLAPEGVHHLTSDNARIQATVYGRGTRESYAYVAGMSTKVLSNRLYVGDRLMWTPHDSIKVCKGDTVDFRLRSDVAEQQRDWFVDGMAAGWHDSTYRFVVEGTESYEVSVALPDMCDTLRAYVVVEKEVIYVDTGICEGAVYAYDGIEYSHEGDYERRLTVTEGCVWLNLRLRVKAVPQVSIESSQDCESKTTTLIVGVTSDCEEPIYWSSVPADDGLESQSGSSVVTVAPSVGSVYTVSVGDMCVTTESVEVEPVHLIEAEMEVRPENPDADDLYITAYDRTLWSEDREWYVNGQMQGEKDRALEHCVVGYGDSVWLMLVVRNGMCVDTAEIAIRLRHDALWAPNVFTPGLDANNRFAIITRDIVQTRLEIYNRWGLLVFGSDNPTEGWDGRHDGELCKYGTYVWKLWYRPRAEDKPMKMATGTVMIIR